MTNTDKIKIDQVIREGKCIRLIASCAEPLSAEETEAIRQEWCRKLKYSMVELVLNVSAETPADKPEEAPEDAPADGGLTEAASAEKASVGEATESDEALREFWDTYREDLRAVSPSVWAILEGSALYVADGVLQVGLNKDLASILRKRRCDIEIGKAFSRTFSRDIKVEIRYQPGEEPKKEAAADTVKVTFSMEDYKAAAQHNTARTEGYQKVYGGQGRGYNRGDGKTGKKRRITPEEGAELPKDPEGCAIIIGKTITDPITPMKDVSTDSGFVAVKGKVFHAEIKPIPSGSEIALLQMTDGTYSVTAKFFFDPSDEDFVVKTFVKDSELRLKVYGEALLDKYTRELTIMAKSIASYHEQPRMDDAEVKRVELHLHTNMSAVDGLTKPEELVRRVISWGHPALAITDHGVVQAYPDIFNAVSKAKSDLKIIYGIECYLTGQEGKLPPVQAKKVPSYHCIILARNQVGLKNLYKLISRSNLDYFYRKPRMPRFEIEALREGLIIGSACSEGELYDALLHGAPEEELERIASFYDYLEIQPTLNNMYLVRNGAVESLKEIEDLNKRIVALGDKLGKMTVATCDVHFLDPEDEIYRCVMQTGQGYTDAEHQPPLYLRTTKEMLEEFSYLGERAYEIVVENTNRIADQIERIRPVPAGFFPPVIEGSDDTLRSSAYEKARRIYGEELPPLIEARLKRELDAIIGNGYSVMYITAKELVAESARNGYTVGSRGSVGSSLAAYMSDITEVNSLPAHYRCPDCGYLEFHENEGFDCGYDMPRKDCPNCHRPLIRDGYDIPFETFLGFNGDKVPDIDLNFASDDQSNAHKYTEVLFGADYVFRAGTISGLAEKTAKGYVRKYLEVSGKQASEAELNRLASGFIGVRKTTGQHPGGIMVIPKDHEIYDFTPIQHPADAVDSDTVTTHFDYHFLHDNILKLDILGHDGPAMLKLLEEFSGVSHKEAILDDDRVMSLFNSAEALELDPEKLKIDISLGTLGIPEFGTNFVIQMLKETRPHTLSELVRISGVSHGTDVWTGNAQKLIAEGTCTLSQAICCRDDIMLYLIKMGLEKKMAFTIMEAVRKGKGLKPEWEEAMKEHKVPDWYIESCKMIKYMFPKAHAVAYVVLSVRIAWYKLYHPLAYYSARFTLKSDMFDAASMIHGQEKAYSRYLSLGGSGDVGADEEAAENSEGKQKSGDLSAKEEGQSAVYDQVFEMYARGLEFLPVDIYRSRADAFVPEDGKIRPPFCSLQGLGAAAAENIVKARENGGVFLSVEDLKTRASLNKAVIEILREEGCLEGLQETNQLSFL